MSFLDFLASASLIFFGSVVLQLILGLCLTPLIHFFRTSDPLGLIPLGLMGLTNGVRSYLSASLIGLVTISHSATILGRIVFGAIGVLILLVAASAIMQEKVTAGFYEEDTRRRRNEAIISIASILYFVCVLAVPTLAINRVTVAIDSSLSWVLHLRYIGWIFDVAGVLFAFGILRTLLVQGFGFLWLSLRGLRR